jgi:hypothetical protein
MRIIQFLSYLCVICLIVPAAASAQTPIANGNSTKVVRVVRVDTPPVIDGRLDEAVWGQADVITDFHQVRPDDGTPPSEWRRRPFATAGPGTGRSSRCDSRPVQHESGWLPVRDEQQRRQARCAL